MKVLVTGGAGFIGSHVVDAYVQDGHDVTVIDDLSTGSRANVNPKARLLVMDIREPNISTVFAKNGFDIVNHHAAQMDVRRSVQDPFMDASINILGTLRLLEACRTYGVRKFIFASSGGTLYGECPNEAAKESSPLNPESPYGYSKMVGETYIRFYGRMYRFPFTILRYANVYGPRQDPHGEAGVVAIFIGKLLAKGTITIFGTGEQERDYVYVSDVVSANRAVLLKGENGTFNIGTGVPTSVNALHKRLGSLYQDSVDAIYVPPRPGELNRSVLNPSLAQKELGWSPAYTLDKGLKETLDYFRQQKKPLAAKQG